MEIVSGIDSMMDIINENKILKKGVSGIMRVKNDAEFIEACIDSCIEALDELIIVYNDCIDSTPELIEKKRLQYPNKIKIYEYKHKVYGVNLTKEEYEYVNNLPLDSPNLLCNYYNYALSKVNYSYAMKIDADQIYYTKELKKWCDICRLDYKPSRDVKYMIGLFAQIYFMIYRFICFRLDKKIPFLPKFLMQSIKSCYFEYAKYEFAVGNACLSLSGVNVFKDSEWCVSLGHKNDIINIMPPFNGEGDHLIFKVSNDTFYIKYDMPYYNKLRSCNYSLIEEFKHPYKVLCVGFCWFHLNAMREMCRDKVKIVKSLCPQSFIELSKFYKLNFRDIQDIMGNEMITPRQCVIFEFTYLLDSESIRSNTSLLSSLGDGQYDN